MDVDSGFIHVRKRTSCNASEDLHPRLLVVVGKITLKPADCAWTDWNTKESTEALGNLSLRDVEVYYLVDQKGSYAPTESMQIFEARIFAKVKITPSTEIRLKDVFYKTYL